MKRLLMFAPAALALLVVGAVLVHREDRPDAAGEPGGADATAAPATGTVVGDLAPDTVPLAAPEPAARRSSAANTVSGTVPLPPPDTPFDQLVDALTERADRGDARAACRLAAEMSRCRFALQAPDADQMDEWFSRRAARRQLDDDAEAEAIAEHNARVQAIEQSRALCAGAEADQLLRQPWYDLQAARAGDDEAALRFVTGQGMEPSSMVRDPALAQLYRDHAMAQFERLLAQGRPEMAWLWYAATRERSMRFMPISGVLPEAWDRPDVAAALFARINEGNEHGIGAQFGGGGRDREPPSPDAVARAESLFERHFAGSPHVADAEAARLRRTAPEVAHCDAL